MTMFLLISMVMMGVLNFVECNPEDTPDYPWFCVPPNGTFQETTTANPGDLYGLLPIERCCPACDECVNLGGHCKLKWITEIYPEWCDFKTEGECRDYSCTCCIKCGEDKCSDCTQTGGNCRVDCRVGEKEDYYTPCQYDGCKCCKRCEPTAECNDAYGQCVTSPDYCPPGTYASTGCCGGCYCCKPVLQGTPPDGCSEEGAYCSETDDCAEGYYACFGQCQKTLWQAEIHIDVPGYCCVPKAVVRRRSVDTFVKRMIGDEAHGHGGRSQDQF